MAERKWIQRSLIAVVAATLITGAVGLTSAHAADTQQRKCNTQKQGKTKTEVCIRLTSLDVSGGDTQLRARAFFDSSGPNASKTNIYVSTVKLDVRRGVMGRYLDTGVAPIQATADKLTLASGTSKLNPAEGSGGPDSFLRCKRDHLDTKGATVYAFVTYWVKPGGSGGWKTGTTVVNGGSITKYDE